MITTLFLVGLAFFLIASILALTSLPQPSLWWRRLSLVLIFSGLVAISSAAIMVLAGDLQHHATLYTIADGLSISLLIDRLAAFFIIVICIVAACATIYSFDYIEHYGDPRRRHWLISMMALFILSMIMVVASANFFCLLFFWEIMSLSSFFLVILEREQPESRKAGVYYLVMTQFSTLFILLGGLTLYHFSGTFDITATALTAGALTLTSLSFFVGFGTKAGLMPFHKWLPYAHAASPSNVSALMSGVMLKVAIYGLVRVMLDVLSPPLWWSGLLLGFGTISAVLGVIYALKEHDLKKLLSFHSIENIGIIVIGLGLYGIFNHYGLDTLATLSLAGALFHTLNHAIFKSLLFMTAGSVVNATGTRNIEEMGGLIKRMPTTAIIFLIGAIAISALPPLNGFASEILLFQAYLGALELPNSFMAVLLFISLATFALMSALAAACFVKAFGIVFLALPRSPAAAIAKEVSFGMRLAPAILAGFCVILGIGSYQLLRAIGLELPVPNLLPVSLIVAIVVGIAILLVRRLGAPVRYTDTWNCGLGKQTGRMEYSATGFSEPIITIFSPIFRTRKVSQSEFADLDKTIIRSGHAEIKTLQFFEERIYLPLARLALRIGGLVSRWHNTDMDNFVLYAFVAIVVLILAAGWLL